ncbi:DUF1534 domain-containing protein [Pseudomonas sp. WS 5532]|nr:DUF1534 domain-containing protein [Pseudomonas sp. WS 5532]
MTVIFWQHPANVGAGLARDGGVSGNISLPDTPPSRASPTPTGFLIVPPLLRGNASRDALRHQCPSLKPCAEVGRGASRAAFPRRACGTISQDGVILIATERTLEVSVISSNKRMV